MRFSDRAAGSVRQFEISSPYVWDRSKLYTTGEVTLIAVPEPWTAQIVLLGVTMLAAACRATRRS